MTPGAIFAVLVGFLGGVFSMVLLVPWSLTGAADEYSDDNRVVVHCRRCGKEEHFATTTVSGGLAYRTWFIWRHALCAKNDDDMGCSY